MHLAQRVSHLRTRYKINPSDAVGHGAPCPGASCLTYHLNITVILPSRYDFACWRR